MTKDKKAKQAARAYGKAAGVSYTAALRATSGGAGAAGGGGGGGGGEPDGVDGWDDYEPMPLVELIARGIQSHCDKHLVGSAVSASAVDAVGGISLNVELPSGMTEPQVHEVVIHGSSVDVQVDEEYEGGTVACTATATAALTIEGLMAKADAYVAADADIVHILDADFNDHYASVLVVAEIEATFVVTANPEFESVEEVAFEGADLLDN